MRFSIFISLLLLTGCTSIQGPKTDKKYMVFGMYSKDPRQCYFNYESVSDPDSYKSECREFAISLHPEWSQKHVDSIRKGEITIGMLPLQVFASWGYPNDINKTTGAWGTHEQWVYENQYVYFRNGTLTSWQN